MNTTAPVTQSHPNTPKVSKKTAASTRCQTVLLTPRLIERSRCSKTQKHDILRDTQVPGLGVKLYPSGKKTFFVRIRSQGRTSDLKIGDAQQISLKQARQAAQQQLSAFALGQASLQPRVTSPTLQVFYQQQYLPYIQQHLRSWKTCDHHYQRYLLPALGEQPLEAITHDRVLDLQQSLATHLAASSCNRILAVLSALFNLALRWQLAGVHQNPVQQVEPLQLNNKKERYLTDEEMQRLLEAIQTSRSSDHLLPIIQLLALTGARKREVLDLRWQDLDLNNQRWTLTRNKSGKTQYKPLSDAAVHLLTQLYEKRQPNQDWVFANPKTGQPFKKIESSWNRARRQAGLPDLRIHDLRHNFASQLVNAGRSLYEVQKLLGHANTTTTQRYAHLAQERLLDAASSIHLPDLKPINERPAANDAGMTESVALELDLNAPTTPTHQAA